jgi:4-hydroxy-4-methyl-2-oxoglutarate aldolase
MDSYVTPFLDRYSTALLADAAFRAGIEPEVAPPGLAPLSAAAKIAGPIVTVNAENDLVAILAALHQAKAGSVLLIVNKTFEVGLIGDLIALEGRRKGLAGIVVDGLVRDSPELEKIGLPVFSRGVWPVGPLKLPPRLKGVGQIGGAVHVGEATVMSGDWAFGDRDGIIFLGADDLAGVFDWAKRSWEREEALAVEIRSGNALGDLLQIEAFLARRATDERADFNKHLLSAGWAI